MKASISSTVRGTQVSSSIPVAVTAMSSSIRTCTEHTVTKAFQTGMRSTSGSSSSSSEGTGCCCNPDTASPCKHGTACHHRTLALQAPTPLGPLALPPSWHHTASWWPLVWWWHLRCLCCIGYIKDSLSEVLQQWVHAMPFHGASKSHPLTAGAVKRTFFPGFASSLPSTWLAKDRASRCPQCLLSKLSCCWAATQVASLCT